MGKTATTPPTAAERAEERRSRLRADLIGATGMNHAVYTLTQLARLLGISRMQVHRLVNDGTIETTTIGQTRYVAIDTVLDLITGQNGAALERDDDEPVPTSFRERMLEAQGDEEGAA